MTSERPTERAGTVVVRDRIIVQATEGVAALARRALGELIGRPFTDWIVPEERAAKQERAGHHPQRQQPEHRRRDRQHRAQQPRSAPGGPGDREQLA